MVDKFDTIITLLTTQEERLAKKIDSVHHDVKTQNSRVSKLETKTELIKLHHMKQEEETQSRTELCSQRFAGLEVHQRIIKAVNWFASHKKGTLITAAILFLITEAFMHHAMSQGWLKQIFQFITKLF